MSLLRSTNDGWLISHRNYINKIYDSVFSDDGNMRLLINENLFKLNSQFLRNNQSKLSIKRRQSNDGNSGNKKEEKKKKKKKKRMLLPQNRLEQIEFIHQRFERMMSIEMKGNFFSSLEITDNNRKAREAAKNFYLDTFEEPRELHGSNNTEYAVIKNIEGVKYVFPANCTFFSYDMRTIADRLDLNNQFDFILMDPPWWNKFIRRKRKHQVEAGYEMVHNEELLKIPISKLMKANGIVGIWCTNAESHLRYILDVIFPTWNMKPVATWFWVKVTESGSTVCNFNYEPGKQPYELLIFGAGIEECNTKIPDKKILISVPSSIHSHKPPLSEIIEAYLPINSRCLELFARYLLPHWTSWGFEVLKFQHLELYSIENVTHN